MGIVNGALANGKTALVQAFAEHAAESGAAVLSATASTELAFPLGVVEQLFQECEKCDDDIARTIESYVGPAPPTGAHDDAPGRVGQVTVSLLRTLSEALLDLAGRQPVIIVVDDASLADVPSLQCLLHLVRRLRSSALMLVLVERDNGPMLPRRFQAELLRLLNYRQITLGALSPTGVAAWLESTLGTPVEHAFTAAAQELTGGNPLLLSAVIDDQRSSRGRPGAGHAYMRAMLDLLYRGGVTLSRVADALAVLGDPASISLLSRSTDTDEAAAARAVEVMGAAGLLTDSGRFRHGAMRRAILDGMAPDARRGLHARAARLLHEDGAAPSAVAAHVLASDDIPQWSIPVLHLAARQAMTEGDTDSAIDYLRRAYDACSDAGQRAALAALLISAQWPKNPAAAVHVYLPELFSALQDGLLKQEHSVQTFNHLLWHGRTAEVATTMGAENGRMPNLDDTDLWLPYVYPGLFEGVRGDRAERPSASLAGSTVPVWAPQRQAATAMGEMLRGMGSEESLAKAEQLLLGTRLSDITLLPTTAALVTMLWGGRLDTVASWCDMVLRDPAITRMPMWQAIFTCVRGTVHYLRGELADAERCTRGALTLVSPECWGVAVGMPLAFLVLAATAMGKYELARIYLHTHVPDAMFQTLCGPYYLSARGQFHLSVGRYGAALSDFLACGEALTRWGFDNPEILPWRSQAAQAYLCVGDADRAGVLVRDQLDLVRPDQTRAHAATLRLHAASHEGEKKANLLRKAASYFERSGDALELAYTLADLSHAHTALGLHDQADTAARQALQLADQCGAVPLKTALLATITQSAPMLPSAFTACDSEKLAALSNAERRVALLAAQGFANREIADELFITVSTVEQHLTRVYRKLSVKRRSELEARFRTSVLVRND
ncbi:hypothetical protein GCM10022254_31810 [Actinomadura meridiana]|uniref:HTH luxR-type domain-containing protein n=1 Tax=Actinomadura meridiana TaxID=559626 RepID=A0ABP8C242_9ACTN